MKESQSRRPSRKGKANFNIYDFEPIFEDDLLVLADGRVAVGFRINCTEFQRYEQGEYERLATTVSQMLAALPVGSVAQYLDIYYNLPFVPGKSENLLERKTNEFFADRLMLKNEAYLYVSFPKDDKNKGVNALSTIFAALTRVENPYENIERRLGDAENQAFQVKSNLETMDGISLERMTDADNERLYHRYFNFEFAREVEGYEKEISRHTNCVTVGDRNLNVVTLAAQGEQWYTSRPDYFGVAGPYSYPLSSGLNFPHITNISIWTQDTEKVLSDLDFQRKLNVGIGGRFGSTQVNDIQAEELEEYTKYIRAEKIKLVKFGVSVIVPSDNEWQRDERVFKVRKAFANIEGATVLVEGSDTTSLYFAFAPGNAINNYRWLNAEAMNASVYMPFTSAYYPDNTGVLLTDREFNPVVFNNFDEEMDGQNAIVVGPTGSGKSVTMGYFILQDYYKGVRQIIIDKGGTYKNLVTFLGGRYFEYNAENPLKLNPFNIEKESVVGSGGRFRYKLTLMKKEYLVAFLTLIWKGKGGKIATDEKSVLLNLISGYYESLEAGETAKLEYFYVWLENYIERGEREQDAEYLLNAEGVNFKQLKLVLRPFANGEYRELCNADEILDISDNKLVCFDMKKIEDNETLFPIVSLMVTELTQDISLKYSNEVKKVYMDECWSFMVSLEKYIEELYRTIRKNRGAIWTISQSVNEFVESSIGEVIKTNSTYKVILNHAGRENIVRTKLAEYMELTDNNVAKVLSLIRRQESREIAIKKLDYMKVYNVEIPPEIMAILTSKPTERDLFNEIVKLKNYNYVLAIREYIEHGYNNKTA